MTVAEQVEVGFEINGQFYGWSVSDNAKDLMLIDRLTGLPAHEFFEAVEDERERGRGPMLLTMLATSIRAKHPDWSVERIDRTVMALNLSDVKFIGADDEEEVDAIPPAQAGTDPSDQSSEKSSGSPESTSEPQPETQD